MDRSGTIAVVSARFGPDVVGGAEQVLRELAIHLAERGWDVEALTTTSIDHYDWTESLPPGESEDHGVRVRRFPVVLDAARGDRHAIAARAGTEGQVPLHDQERWLNADMRCPALFEHLVDRGDRYRVVIAGPYHAWTSFVAASLLADRTLLMPCLHREPEAAFELFEPVFAGVAGLLFLADPEAGLMDELHPHHAPGRVVGAGFDPPRTYDPDGFRARHGLHRPFVAYAGRREGAKGWEGLVAGFARAVFEHRLPLQLVTMGVGDVRVPPKLTDLVVDLGFVGERERDDAMAAADAYVQPSALESFSRSICEAWLAGTPVIANAKSDVVRWHCERSAAGVTYDDEDQLVECLRFCVDEPELAARMGSRGRDYVLSHYLWPDVVDRIEELIVERLR